MIWPIVVNKVPSELRNTSICEFVYKVVDLWLIIFLSAPHSVAAYFKNTFYMFSISNYIKVYPRDQIFKILLHFNTLWYTLIHRWKCFLNIFPQKKLNEIVSCLLQLHCTLLYKYIGYGKFPCIKISILPFLNAHYSTK